MIILLGYALPLTVVAMYLDITYDLAVWIWFFYLLCPTVHGVLCRAAILSQSSWLVFAGNLLGGCTNYGLWLLVQTEHWNAYFKWLPSSGRMFSFLAVSFAIQLWIVFYDYAKRHWKKA